MPSGALTLLILRVLRSGTLHGYAIAQRIHSLSSEVLQVEEGALYPALQKILLKGWATAEWGISETNRKVRFYRSDPRRPQTTGGRTLRLPSRARSHRRPFCAPPEDTDERILPPPAVSVEPPPLRPGAGGRHGIPSRNGGARGQGEFRQHAAPPRRGARRLGLDVDRTPLAGSRLTPPACCANRPASRSPPC